MTASNGSEQPGRNSASAFASTPSRNFDGGLLERHTYTLTRADALAYLRLKRDWPGWAKWAFGLWFLFGGAVWGLLPETLRGSDQSWQSLATFLAVIALQFGLLWLGRGIWRHWRAQQMVPAPRRAEFEEWIDCIAGSEIDADDCAYLSPELIGQVLETPTHIFVLNHNTRIVLPKRAFETPEKATAMAAYIRELADGPYYFDP